MANKFSFGSNVTGHIKGTVRRDIMQSESGSKDLRSEIRRVFQQANRRIQNLERNTNVFSPALQALTDVGEGYSKFAMRGKSWTELKMLYGKAIQFLSQPTSTVTGAREYNNQIKQRNNLSDEGFNALVSAYNSKLGSLSGAAFADAHLNFYKEIGGEFEQVIQSAAAQMEADAVNMDIALNNAIIDAADEVGDIFDTDELFEIF